MGDARAHAAPLARAGLLRGWVAEHDRWIEVGGSSMRPTISPPAHVLVRAATSPQAGEVWAFVDATGELLVHRCLGADGTGRWRFRGDGRFGGDAPVARERLVGRAVRLRDRRGERALPASTAPRSAGAILSRVLAALGNPLETAQRGMNRTARILRRWLTTGTSHG